MSDFMGLPARRLAGSGVVFIHAGDATGRRTRTGMVLSCCRRHGTGGGKNAAVAIRPKIELRRQLISTQKRMLKMELKGGRRALATRKDALQMFHRLQQRDRCAHWPGALAGGTAGSRSRSSLWRSSAPQPIDRFQGKGQPQFFRRRLERKRRPAAWTSQLPHQRSRQRVARQNVRQHEGKCPPATAALSAIGTKHPLAPDRLASRRRGIVATKVTVPVQCAHSPQCGQG